MLDWSSHLESLKAFAITYAASVTWASLVSMYKKRAKENN